MYKESHLDTIRNEVRFLVISKEKSLFDENISVQVLVELLYSDLHQNHISIISALTSNITEYKLRNICIYSLFDRVLYLSTLYQSQNHFLNFFYEFFYNFEEKVIIEVFSRDFQQYLFSQYRNFFLPSQFLLLNAILTTLIIKSKFIAQSLINEEVSVLTFSYLGSFISLYMSQVDGELKTQYHKCVFYSLMLISLIYRLDRVELSNHYIKDIFQFIVSIYHKTPSLCQACIVMLDSLMGFHSINPNILFDDNLHLILLYGFNTEIEEIQMDSCKFLETLSLSNPTLFCDLLSNYAHIMISRYSKSSLMKQFLDLIGNTIYRDSFCIIGTLFRSTWFLEMFSLFNELVYSVKSSFIRILCLLICKDNIDIINSLFEIESSIIQLFLDSIHNESEHLLLLLESIYIIFCHLSTVSISDDAYQVITERNTVEIFESILFKQSGIFIEMLIERIIGLINSIFDTHMIDSITT